MGIQKQAEQKTYKTHGQKGNGGNLFPKKKAMDEKIAKTEKPQEKKTDGKGKDGKYAVPLYDCYD